jgi:hypothetical protein
LHAPGHAHFFKPNLRGDCDGCTPPVHGSILLLRAPSHEGEPLIERRGADVLADRDWRSVRALSSILEWRRRSHCRKLAREQRRRLSVDAAADHRPRSSWDAASVTAAMMTPKHVSRRSNAERMEERRSARAVLELEDDSAGASTPSTPTLRTSQRTSQRTPPLPQVCELAADGPPASPSLMQRAASRWGGSQPSLPSAAPPLTLQHAESRGALTPSPSSVRRFLARASEPAPAPGRRSSSSVA